MRNETLHLSDQELLLAVDDELSRRQSARVRAHLAACEACRARLSEIESTFAEFAHIRQIEGNHQLPPVDGPRALLMARLAASAAARSRGLWPSINWLASAASPWVVTCAALFLAALGIMAIRYEARSREAEPPLAADWREPIPDKTLTPGATRPVTAAEVCRDGGGEQSHPIPASMRQRVFREYRTSESHAAEYEVDFLITPGLGGAVDIRNLWPEPYSSTVWNAHVKDELEDLLHELVCSGKLDLATAQRDIATNWISAYKKYFHTQSPISSSSGFASDHL
jgi:hypothetical protein